MATASSKRVTQVASEKWVELAKEEEREYFRLTKLHSNLHSYLWKATSLWNQDSQVSPHFIQRCKNIFWTVKHWSSWPFILWLPIIPASSSFYSILLLLLVLLLITASFPCINNLQWALSVYLISFPQIHYDIHFIILTSLMRKLR